MMRRSDKEVTDPGLISRIIGNSQVCRLGLAKDNVPYILPVAFGYDGAALYIHTAKAGRKIEFIQANSRVCFEFEHAISLKPHRHTPCDWSFSFQTVIGYGTIRELTAPAEISAGLNLIMRQYSHRDWIFSEEKISALRVWKIAIESLTGKQSKDMATL